MDSGRGTETQSKLEVYRERLGFVALGIEIEGQPPLSLC